LLALLRAHPILHVSRMGVNVADGFEMIAAEENDPFFVTYSALQVFTFVLFATYSVSFSPCVVYSI